jgi:CheY-like chemotaxis protein
MPESAALSVLLVEDEPLIRMMVTDMLDELGHRVVAEAANVDQAAMLVRSTAFDLAILDVNLDGATSFPVADAIVARGIPVIFATGYGSPSMVVRYSRSVRLQKPYGIEMLRLKIDLAMRGTIHA